MSFESKRAMAMNYCDRMAEICTRQLIDSEFTCDDSQLNIVSWMVTKEHIRRAKSTDDIHKSFNAEKLDYDELLEVWAK